MTDNYQPIQFHIEPILFDAYMLLIGRLRRELAVDAYRDGSGRLRRELAVESKARKQALSSAMKLFSTSSRSRPLPTFL